MTVPTKTIQDLIDELSVYGNNVGFDTKVFVRKEASMDELTLGVLHLEEAIIPNDDDKDYRESFWSDPKTTEYENVLVIRDH